jgi:hypothetical protein
MGSCVDQEFVKIASKSEYPVRICTYNPMQHFVRIRKSETARLNNAPFCARVELKILLSIQSVGSILPLIPLFTSQ